MKTEVKQYQFERMNLSVSRILTDGTIKEELDRVPGLRNTLRLDIRDSYTFSLAKHLVLELTGWILRDKHEHELVYKSEEITINVPLTWWDMLKQEHFPEGWLKRWPVKTVGLSKKVHFQYEQQVRVCPHANVAWPDERHLHFLTFETTPLAGVPEVTKGKSADSGVMCPSCGVGQDTDGDGGCALCGPLRRKMKEPERPAKYEG